MSQCVLPYAVCAAVRYRHAGKQILVFPRRLPNVQPLRTGPDVVPHSARGVEPRRIPFRRLDVCGRESALCCGRDTQYKRNPTAKQFAQHCCVRLYSISMAPVLSSANWEACVRQQAFAKSNSVSILAPCQCWRTNAETSWQERSLTSLALMTKRTTNDCKRRRRESRRPEEVGSAWQLDIV